MAQAQLLDVTVAEIEAAQARAADAAWRTPLVPSQSDDAAIHLKLECLQRTGSFKVRGAWNRMSDTSPVERGQGFTTVSAGNHGRAVAWCAHRLGATCTVWVPEQAAENKVEAIRGLGATVERLPHRQIMEALADDAFARAHPVFVHPFADSRVIAGQGTIGLEILDDLPDVGTVIVPVGGGGLATGIATAVKSQKAGVTVVGVQAEVAAPYADSWRTGRPERIPTPTTIADGIGASIAYPSMWPILRSRLDRIVTVTEDAMRTAMRSLATETRVVVEAAGAAALAAARQHVDELPHPIVCVISGGNVNPSLLRKILE